MNLTDNDKMYTPEEWEKLKELNLQYDKIENRKKHLIKTVSPINGILLRIRVKGYNIALDEEEANCMYQGLMEYYDDKLKEKRDEAERIGKYPDGVGCISCHRKLSESDIWKREKKCSLCKSYDSYGK